MTVIDRIGNWTPTQEQMFMLDGLWKAAVVMAKCGMVAAAVILLIQPVAHLLFLLIHGKGAM